MCLVLGICPRCQRTYVADDHDFDYVHQCDSGVLALDQEDSPKAGDYTADPNSVSNATDTTPKAPMLQGLGNRVYGTRAGIEGVHITGFTVRGNKAPTNRQRQHYETIELERTSDYCAR